MMCDVRAKVWIAAGEFVYAAGITREDDDKVVVLIFYVYHSR